MTKKSARDIVSGVAESVCNELLKLLYASKFRHRHIVVCQNKSATSRRLKTSKPRLLDQGWALAYKSWCCH
ncbi:hypothetical protein Plhal304r1_c057g0142591 [Plasmopara halstedii]